MNIDYDHMIELLVKHVPEIAAKCELELRWWGTETPGPHVVYGDVLNPHVDELIQSGDEVGLRRVFDFVERLARSSDPRVAEVVAVTVCEHLGANAARLQAARRFMGPVTHEISLEVEAFWRSLAGAAGKPRAP